MTIVINNLITGADLNKNIPVLILAAFLTIGMPPLSFCQNLSDASGSEIEIQVLKVFDKSIQAGESLDVTRIAATVNDSLKAGFIDNGSYFRSFDDLMVTFKSGIQGLVHQTMNVGAKKITVLSANHALLTAHGKYSAEVADGRVLNGEFAWTIVYAKINGKWKVIHSHMSNPEMTELIEISAQRILLSPGENYSM